MKKSTKVIISGVVIAVIGVIIIIASLAVAGWKFKDNYEMKSFTESGQNSAITIDWSAGNVKTEFYDGDKIEVTYPSSKMYQVTITERGNTITVKSKNKYILWIGPHNIPETVIKLPKSVVYDMTVDIDAGNAYLADGAYKNVNIDIDAGTLKCGTITCNRLDCNLDAGKVEINGVTANYLKCDIDAGSAEISAIVCPEIYVDIDAGNVNLKIDAEKSLYNIFTKVSAGKCNINSQSGTSASHRLNIDVSAGNVSVAFADN